MGEGIAKVGQIDVRLEVNKGQIEECRIYGDFFGVGDVSEVENKLKHIRYDYVSLEEALVDVNVQHYFGNITKEEFINLIY